MALMPPTSLECVLDFGTEPVDRLRPKQLAIDKPGKSR